MVSRCGVVELAAHPTAELRSTVPPYVAKGKHLAETVPELELPPIACDVLCPDCGYNLRSLTGARCPECGYGLERIHQAEPQLPWARRKQLGRFRAYWGTILYVRFRHRRFCEEMARPVSYADAQRFRWVTVLHAWLPLLVASAVLYVATPEPAAQAPEAARLQRMMGQFVPEPSLFDRIVSEGWPVILANVCILLFLAAATGVPSCFFHPKALPVEMQNRAVALSYYTCWPLALLVVPLLFWSLRDPYPPPRWLVLCGLVSLLVPLLWWGDLWQTARRVMRPHPLRLVLVAICVPILWALLAALTLLAFPAVVFYVLGIFVSLA